MINDLDYKLSRSEIQRCMGGRREGRRGRDGEMGGRGRGGGGGGRWEGERGNGR